MNITIRNINRKLYQEFKAEAARRGLKVGEALTLAMQDFVKSEKKSQTLSILDFRANSGQKFSSLEDNKEENVTNNTDCQKTRTPVLFILKNLSQ